MKRQNRWMIAVVICFILFIRPMEMQAKTKVSTPSVSFTYNADKDSWYLKVTSKQKNAKLYYKQITDVPLKWREVPKNGCIKIYASDNYRVMAKVGKSYSSQKSVDCYKLISNKIKKDCSNLVKALIGNSTNDLEKFGKISEYCCKTWENGDFGGKSSIGGLDYLRTIYEHEGNGRDLNFTYNYLLKLAGIECEYVDKYVAKNDYGYDYQYNYYTTWSHVKLYGHWHVVEMKGGTFHGLYVDPKYSYPKVGKCKIRDFLADNMRVYDSNGESYETIIDMMIDGFNMIDDNTIETKDDEYKYIYKYNGKYWNKTKYNLITGEMERELTPEELGGWE